MSAFVQGRSFATFFAILISESSNRYTIQSQSGEMQYYAIRGVWMSCHQSAPRKSPLRRLLRGPPFESKGKCRPNHHGSRTEVGH
jgi:hypothetical protein